MDVTKKIEVRQVQVAVHGDYHTLYVVDTRGRLFRSIDSGETWTEVKLPKDVL